MARDATELVRSAESPLLFHHSTRVYLFGALAGARKNLKFDHELLYIAAMFHDMGLIFKPYSSASERFEVDGANIQPAKLPRRFQARVLLEQVSVFANTFQRLTNRRRLDLCEGK